MFETRVDEITGKGNLNDRFQNILGEGFEVLFGTKLEKELVVENEVFEYFSVLGLAGVLQLGKIEKKGFDQSLEHPLLELLLELFLGLAQDVEEQEQQGLVAGNVGVESIEDDHEEVFELQVWEQAQIVDGNKLDEQRGIRVFVPILGDVVGQEEQQLPDDALLLAELEDFLVFF